MYRIINVSNGVEVGVTENPRFIKKTPAGIYVETTPSEARGIAYKSTPYNLFGTEGVGAEETVLLREFDGGAIIQESQNSYPDLDAIAVDHEYRLAMLELGLTASGGTV